MQNTGVFLSKNLESNNMPPATTRAAAKLKQSIWVTFQVPGIHCYPDAPEDVAYLRNPHRHMFGFKVAISVLHDNREIEFHQFKNWLTALYSSGCMKADHKSCEMLSDELAEVIAFKYPRREFEITIDEDGECGSTTTYGSVLAAAAAEILGL